MNYVKGIDISKWQGNYDLADRVKNHGCKFVIMRVGFGRGINNMDKQFLNNYEKACELGILKGGYQYSYAVNVEQARQEAITLIKWLDGKHFELPIFWDVEDKSQMYLSKATLEEMFKAWSEVVENAGYVVGVYANQYWYNSKLSDYVKNNCVRWVAKWAEKEPSSEWEIWQFTSNDGKLDEDYMKIGVYNAYKNVENSVDNVENPAKEIRVGDTVRVKSGAVYGGLYKKTMDKPVPNWVQQEVLTVRKLAEHNGVKEALLHPINSWVALKYLY